jgi:hypothetical protein
MERRQFLKASVASTLALAIRPTATFAIDRVQKFKIGMAATTWLSANPSTATYWNATEAIKALDIGATEADNSKAEFDVAYKNRIADLVCGFLVFTRRSCCTTRRSFQKCEPKSSPSRDS